MRAHISQQILTRTLFVSVPLRSKLLHNCRTITSLPSSPIDPAVMTVNTTTRLEKLRALMRANGADIYVVPSGDSHNSEYISACDGRREYISGFTGSSGVAVVAANVASLSTDGRYFNQASQELDSNWTLLKQGLKDVPTWQEWAAQESKDGKVVAIDASLVTGPDVEVLESKIKASGSGKLIALDDNLVDIAWGSDRPARQQAPVFVHPQQYAGQTVRSKLTALREELRRTNSLGLFVTMLDEIAYLFNLRGSDIDFNPVFFSYAIITATSATLYVEKSRFEANVTAHLEESGVEVKPYDSFFPDTRTLYETAKSSPSPHSGRFQVMNTGSWALKRALGDGDLIEEIKSPIALAKSVKNETELNGMRNCHMRDGAAIIEYLAWLEDQLVNHKATISEAEGADKLENFRSQKQWFKGQSFDTISSTGPNAAIMHYKPEHGSDSPIDPAAIYLLDSGAQYLDGTTDTTRTVHIGTPTEMEMEAYTRALKANIALDRAIFPQGVSGFAIDCIARQHLWNAGWDFRHGTGHGVGSFLNVHEGPIGIGIRPHYAESPLVAGNVLSNEPGFYADGAFGVRIENMIIVKEVKTKYCFGDRAYLGFENITVVPYCRKLMKMDLLTTEEKDWLNKNNALILERTKPFVSNDPITSAWLVRETQPY